MNNKLSKISASILLGTMLVYTLPVAAFTKDETVYTNAKSNGEQYQTIVTDHLINEEDEKLLKDMTNLLNIENTSGDEKFTQDGESLVWEADSNDIYYKGEIDQELTVKLNIKYELDGKEISSDEIAGKSGKVKITISFENKEEHEVQINGKTEKMYTPFVVATGTYINNDNNKNIEVTNGKAIDDGSKTMVVGLTFPGMQESLNIDKDTLEIPTSIEITMETTNFEMNNIINYTTPKLIEDSELDIFSKLDDIYSKVETLQSASKQIENGAKTLSDGTTTYVEKSEEFNQALNKFSDGVSSANTSYSRIDAGIKNLNSSVPDLTSGTKSLSDNLGAVNNGVKTMSDMLDGSQESMNNLKNGAQNISGGLTQLSAAMKTTDYTEQINKIKSQIGTNTKMITTLTTTTEQLSKVLEDTTLSEATAQAIKAQITANQSTIATLTADNAYLNNMITSLNASNTQIGKLKQQVDTLAQGAKDVSDGVNGLLDQVGELNTKIKVLNTNTGKMAVGANKLYQGTLGLEAGTTKLAQGSEQMKAGLSTINTSSQALYSANNQLVEGAKTIQSGAAELAEGTAEFNKTGIDVICNYVTGDLKNLETRAEKLKELSDGYNTFTKLDDENKGKVKFITVVDSIKKDDNKGQEEIDEKTSK